MQLIPHDSLHSHHTPPLPHLSTLDKTTAHAVTSNGSSAASSCCGCTAATCGTCREDSWKLQSAGKPSQQGRSGSSTAWQSSGSNTLPAPADRAAVQKLPCNRHNVWVMRQVLGSRPVVSIVFDGMDMRVGAPQEMEVGSDGRLKGKQ